MTTQAIELKQDFDAYIEMLETAQTSKPKFIQWLEYWEVSEPLIQKVKSAWNVFIIDDFFSHEFSGDMERLEREINRCHIAHYPFN
ncbi:hypothetical protein [Paenibacillus elgii]|uniref:hypothetical protein n=1 Tax=Paenibacillus elgii TaxID=189691 RepID=UPI00203CD8F8|nr:hypothetical protein [Paenibacillus elgii]MCM3271143.1 hypothetical protein [Paenibacillus elgii]